MSHTAWLQVTQLEEREVPAAALFADIHPGVWGSYPQNLIPSGNALFFSADNGHGYELYATDGTPGSAHLVKDIKPGLGGSDPADFYTADGGVVYFTANAGDGNRSLWRSDGTAAGTTKVPGLPADLGFDTSGGVVLPPGTTGGILPAVGRNGSLYFTTATSLGYGGYYDVRFWKTNGTTTTLLHDFGTSGFGVNTNVALVNGTVTVFRTSPGSLMPTMWVTDGTPGGTRLQQQPLTATDPTFGLVVLNNGIPVSPGVFVHTTATRYATGNTATLWMSDGMNPSSPRLLAAIPTDGQGDSAQTLVSLGHKLYFFVHSPSAADRGLWVTDGTTAGTRHVGLPGVDFNFDNIQMFGGKILLRAYDSPTGRWRFWLTDGTGAGTTEVALPAATAYSVVPPSPGQLPAGPGFPNGALMFHLGPQGQPYLTDGTPTGGRWVDTTGLPPGSVVAGWPFYQLDGDGRAFSFSNWAPSGVYFNGAIYFQAANGDQRAELWKWDMAAPAGQVVAPQVTSVVVNDGSAQRSVVTKLTVTFDRTVHLDDAAVNLKDANGRSVLLYLDAETVGGKTVLTITFGGAGVVGGSLPNGRYTLTIKAGKVSDGATGGMMANDYTFAFTRLFGDLNGDGTYDRVARVMVHTALGRHSGDAGYLAALDSNNDGVIDATDELAAIRNWGKSV
jgi:ELWxxDGT repeat protein